MRVGLAVLLLTACGRPPTAVGVCRVVSTRVVTLYDMAGDSIGTTTLTVKVCR